MKTRIEQILLLKKVLAIQRYHEVYRTVKPKEEKLKTANEALTVMQKSLARKQEMLKLVKRKNTKKIFLSIESFSILLFRSKII